MERIVVKKLCRDLYKYIHIRNKCIEIRKLTDTLSIRYFNRTLYIYDSITDKCISGYSMIDGYRIYQYKNYQIILDKGIGIW